MGTVYEAIDLRFNSQVALKETHFTEEALRKQFEREAHLLYKLRHPAMARVIDHFVENDGQYLVMDFIEGGDLWEMLQKSRREFPVNDVLKWTKQLLDALHYLHSQCPPIIHRDIKPQNLKLSSTGQIILLDFGLAKGLGQATASASTRSIYGYSLNYAALEQIQGERTSVQSDLYSLAATMYHLLTGRAPADAVTRAAAMISDEGDPLLTISEVNRDVSLPLAEVLMKALSMKPSQRPASAIAMLSGILNTDYNAPSNRTGQDETTVVQTRIPTASKAKVMTSGDSQSETPARRSPYIGEQFNYTPPPDKEGFPTIPIEDWEGERFVFLQRRKESQKHGYISIRRVDTLDFLPYQEYVGRVARVTGVRKDTPLSDSYIVELELEDSDEEIIAHTSLGSIDGMAFVADIENARRLFAGKKFFLNQPAWKYDQQKDQVICLSMIYSKVKVVDVLASWDSKSPVRFIIKTPSGDDAFVDVHMSGTNIPEILRKHRRFEDTFSETR